MDDVQEKTGDATPTPEEEKQEEEALKETPDDEIRSFVTESYGLDEDADADLIEKITEREKEQRKYLGKAIEQKRKYRKELETLAQKPKEQPTAQGDSQKKEETLDIEKLLDQKLNERMEKRELESLDLPDELKDEVKKIAQLKEIPVREAAQDPYILHRKEVIEREARIANATPRRSKKGAIAVDIDPGKPLDPADYDMNTEEGVNSWKEAKRARAKYLENK
jgi:hypothetical protein